MVSCKRTREPSNPTTYNLLLTLLDSVAVAFPNAPIRSVECPGSNLEFDVPPEFLIGDDEAGFLWITFS
jgi:hypothetical protein